MILFFNVYVTNEGTGIPYDRGLLRTDDKLDVLMYSIASFSKILPWKRVILNLELDEYYKPREDELHEFVKKEFEGHDLILSNKRNFRQNDWKATYDLFNDRFIWFCGNHDHIYIDNDFEYLNDFLKMGEPHELCMLRYSHFPEFIRNSHIMGNPFDVLEYGGAYMSPDQDSVCILTKELYKTWWFGNDFNHLEFPRPDWKTWLKSVNPIPNTLCFVPYREFARHYDGYVPFNISNSICPALEIPEGFFDNNIQITYGNQKKNKYINFDPVNFYYKAVNNSGADYKWTLDDIPEFWKSRITKKIESFSVIEELMKEYRNRAILKMFNFEGYNLIDPYKERILHFYNRPKNVFK